MIINQSQDLLFSILIVIRKPSFFLVSTMLYNLNLTQLTFTILTYLTFLLFQCQLKRKAQQASELQVTFRRIFQLFDRYLSWQLIKKLNSKLQNRMKRNSKSLRKISPQKAPKKKQCAKKCLKKQITPLNIQNSLYRKYSNSQNFHHINVMNESLKKQEAMKIINEQKRQQCLQKYYKPQNRKHLFPKIKQVYKMHIDIPKISQPEVKKIVDKCYYRKRLLDYFKIAKVLGIKVDSVKCSTFLLSMNDLTNNQMQPMKNYDPIITRISTIDFSSEAERDLLDELFSHERQSPLSHKQNWISAST